MELRNFPNGNWLFNAVTTGGKNGDASDAGMMFYLLNGRTVASRNASMNDIEEFFENGSTTDPTDPTDPGDTVPPAIPSGLSANPGDGEVVLTWDANGEDDLAGYIVRRALPGGALETLDDNVTNNRFVDNDVANGNLYLYTVRSFDTSGNKSVGAPLVEATPVDEPTTPTGGWEFIIHLPSGNHLKANINGENLGTANPNRTGPNVQWQQVSAGDGRFYLLHQASNRYLASNDGNTVITTINLNSSAEWRLVDAGQGYYRLVHVASGNRLHVLDDGVGAFRLGPPFWQGPRTKWRFESAE